ncbi:MAG TPA: DUF2804 domain-containing protein [Acidimicrobiales bacterium]|nr:DUF2804 domain-containing protein [Acidimicrobiales bacterium]
MATAEHEITAPVDLCLPDGRRLAPAARGWSRRPLHTANLRGRRFRTKRWDYWAVLGDDLALAVTYGHVGYLGVATVWWVDLRTGTEGGRDVPAPLGRGLRLPERPGAEPLRFRSRPLDLDLTDDEDGTRLVARWDEADGRPGTLDVHVDQPPGHESLNVVIPWTETLFQYTSKHQARPARGTLRVGDVVHHLGDDDGPAWGVLDVGRGRWPYRTRWNWGGGAGPATDGATVVGLQFGGRWTEGTGATENGVLVDGRLTKIGQELEWSYHWDRPLRPWRVRHPDGSLDVTLTPRHDRHTKVQAVVLATEVHQVFGTWAGHVTTEDGTVVRVDGIGGFAEESRSRW